MSMTAEKTLLTCSHCSKKFKYDSERKRHEQSHFPEFHCKICGKNFSFVSALRRHEKQHERTGTVTCEECGKEFRDHILLKRHTKYAHAGSYICSKCSSIFNSEAALRTHMQSHKTLSERRYHCSHEGCDKKFNFAHHLKHHEMTHTNSKQHFCKICDKGFIQSHHLKTHLKTHSADTSIYCSFPDCNKKFATEYARKRHMTKCHTIQDSEISSDSNPPYEMSINSFKFNIDREDNNESLFAELINETECEPKILRLTTDEEYDEPIIEDLTVLKIQQTDKPEENSDINDCDIVLGSCIMKEEGENCVCNEINNIVDDNYDFTPIETINMSKLSINNNCKSSECCGGHCKNNLLKEDMPEIEYKTDGTVKIKEFLDIDLPDEIVSTKDMKFVPYNSCKAVLGGCIVSGNGTIGDGCLCARMTIDEQVTAEEIEDITPHPKESWTN